MGVGRGGGGWGWGGTLCMFGLRFLQADRASGGLTTFSSLLVAFTVMVIRIRASLTIRSGRFGV